MKINQLLQHLGLTEKESLIYLSLLKTGPASIAGICKETGLFRPQVYKHLPTLKEKNLVTSTVKGKSKLYAAENPNKLKNLLDDLNTSIENALPELIEMHETQKNRPIVKFLEGRKGITFVFDDIVQSLKKGDVFYRYSAVEDKRGENYLPPNYRKIRDKKELQRFVITNEASARKKKPRLERAIKTTPSKYGLFDYNIIQIIYGHKVAFLDYNTETAFIIENPVIAEFQKKIFKILYDNLS